MPKDLTHASEAVRRRNAFEGIASVELTSQTGNLC